MLNVQCFWQKLFIDDVQVRHTILNADVEEDLETQQIQINNIEVDVSLHDERLDSVEDDVDEWDDKIMSLEGANVDITERLITVEEILLGTLRYLY